MKILIFAATLFAVAAPAMAADVGVSVNIGQPGFYGRIDINQFPQPPVIYAQPVIIHRAPRYVEQPIYLRVPPGHAKRWSKHCRKYNACGQQVYFVQDGWYNDVYAPRYRSEHDERRDHRDDGDRRDHHDHGERGGRGDNGKHKGRGHDKD